MYTLPEPVNGYLADDISAMDVMYRGDPSYEHDGYHMRSAIEKMVRNGYAIYTADEVQAAFDAGRASRDAEVEALRADAERWRKFIEYPTHPAGENFPEHQLLMMRCSERPFMYGGVADYNQAIDAARKEK